MNETETIEYVGGPVCGALMECHRDAKGIIVPSIIAGELVDYAYARSERISVRGYVVFEFKAVAVVTSRAG